MKNIHREGQRGGRLLYLDTTPTKILYVVRGLIVPNVHMFVHMILKFVKNVD